jgi:hypothetical protein
LATPAGRGHDVSKASETSPVRPDNIVCQLQPSEATRRSVDGTEIMRFPAAREASDGVLLPSDSDSSREGRQNRDSDCDFVIVISLAAELNRLLLERVRRQAGVETAARPLPHSNRRWER